MDQDVADQYRAQEKLQSQKLEGENLKYAPQIQEQVQQVQAILVEQTNPKRVVEKIMLRLQGKDKRPDGTIVDIAKAKMNKEGIDNVWFILDSHINQNVILSHLDKREIQNIMEAISEDLVDDLSLNWKRYGVEKLTDLDTINNSIMINIYLALKRAEGQNEKNWLGKISIEQISGRGGVVAPKKESFWSKFRV